MLKKNVDSSELPMSNAVLKSTKYQGPVIPTVAQAHSGPSTATLPHVGSAKDTIVGDILLDPYPHPLVTPPTAPTVVDRPPAAPDPVPGVITLPKPSDPAYDCTPATPHSEMQHAHPPNEAVLLSTTASNIVSFDQSSFSPVPIYDCNPAVPYCPSSFMIPCTDTLGYRMSAPYQYLLQLVHGMSKKTYLLLGTSQNGSQPGIQIFGDLDLKFVLSIMDKLYGGEIERPQTGIQIFGNCVLKFIYPTLVDRTDDGKDYICFDLVIPGNNKEVSYTACEQFSVEEGTLYSTVESPSNPNDPVGDLIVLLFSGLLPSPSNRLAPDPLEEGISNLTLGCNICWCSTRHPALAHSFWQTSTPIPWTYPRSMRIPLDSTNQILCPSLLSIHESEIYKDWAIRIISFHSYLFVFRVLPMLECNWNYHCCDQCSCMIADKLPTQHPLMNLHGPLEDIEEEIIFYHADDDGEYDDEDVPMEIELCMPFGTQLFPHHNDSGSQQYLCEVVPSSREVIFTDGEPLPATTKEHYVGDSTIGKPDCFEDPKDTITSSGGFYLNTTGLNQDPALIALSTSTSDGEQTFLENLAGYTQNVYP